MPFTRYVRFLRGLFFMPHPVYRIFLHFTVVRKALKLGDIPEVTWFCFERSKVKVRVRVREQK